MVKKWGFFYSVTHKTCISVSAFFGHAEGWDMSPAEKLRGKTDSLTDCFSACCYHNNLSVSHTLSYTYVFLIAKKSHRRTHIVPVSLNTRANLLCYNTIQKTARVLLDRMSDDYSVYVATTELILLLGHIFKLPKRTIHEFNANYLFSMVRWKV